MHGTGRSGAWLRLSYVYWSDTVSSFILVGWAYVHDTSKTHFAQRGPVEEQRFSESIHSKVVAQIKRAATEEA